MRPTLRPICTRIGRMFYCAQLFINCDIVSCLYTKINSHKCEEGGALTPAICIKNESICDHYNESGEHSLLIQFKSTISTIFRVMRHLHS